MKDLTTAVEGGWRISAEEEVGLTHEMKGGFEINRTHTHTQSE